MSPGVEMINGKLVGEPWTETIENEKCVMANFTTMHQYIRGNIMYAFSNYMKQRGVKDYNLIFSMEVRLDKSNIFIPDICIVHRSFVHEEYVEGIPELVVEIMVPASRFNDMGIKKEIYEKLGVNEYWVIEPKCDTMYSFRLRNGRYELENVYARLEKGEVEHLSLIETMQRMSTIRTEVFEDLEISVNDIFQSPFEEIPRAE